MASHPITHTSSVSQPLTKNSTPYHVDTYANQLSYSKTLLYAKYKTPYLPHATVATSITSHSVDDSHYIIANLSLLSACFILM